MDLWNQHKENGKYIIGYEIHNGMSDLGKELIPKALEIIEDVSCIQFKNQKDVNHTDFIEFVFGDGCWSSVGRDKGKQKIMIGDCAELGNYTIIHEVRKSFGYEKFLDNDS